MKTLVLFVLLCRVCTGSAESVRAKVGEDVILPCVQNTSAEVQAVAWSRPDLGDRSVHFYRDGRDSLENQNAAYAGRTAMFSEEMKTGNVSVKLSRVRLSDAGQYRCYLHDHDQETWVTLAVDVAVDPWLIVLGVVFAVSICVGIALCVYHRNARFKSTKEELDFTIGRLSYVQTRLLELGGTKEVNELIRGDIDALRVPEQAEIKNGLVSRVMEVKLKIQKDIEETQTQEEDLEKRIQELKKRLGMEEGASLEMVPLATANREDAVVDMGVVPDDQDSVGVAQEPGPPPHN